VTVAVGAVVADSGATVAESNEGNNSNTGSVTTHVSNGAVPQIQFDAAATSDLLNVSVDGPGALSGVIGDSTDPARFQGIAFTLSDADTSTGSLTVAATSNNPLVVPNTNIALSGSGANRLVRVEPIGVGYADISVTVSDPQGNSDTYLLRYAASDGSSAPASARWHTSGADASSALALDAGRMVVAIDEDQRLRIVDRDESGLPANEFNANSSLGLTDLSGGLPREVDIEASVRIGDRLYWLGSHSNSSSGSLRPNRQRLFALDYTAPSTLSYVGRYDGLRSDLLAWDSGNAHGLGADFFGLTASAAAGVIPEDATGAGFNIEGLAIAPNGQAYLAFRAPIVPATQRTRAPDRADHESCSTGKRKSGAGTGGVRCTHSTGPRWSRHPLAGVQRHRVPYRRRIGGRGRQLPVVHLGRQSDVAAGRAQWRPEWTESGGHRRTARHAQSDQRAPDRVGPG
jgi:hypothetical protein